MYVGWFVIIVASIVLIIWGWSSGNKDGFRKGYKEGYKDGKSGDKPNPYVDSGELWK